MRAATGHATNLRGRFWHTALALLTATVVVVAAGSTPAAADDPIFVPWSDLLPGLTTQYEPGSSNLCASGQLSCVDSVIAEMTARFNPLATSCSHNAVFSLTYLRTTEEYRRSVADGTFFSDTPFINHQDALFASYYFDAYDAWRAGNLTAVPQAWQLALGAADGKKVSAMGNLLLGMSAHVNRDLPYVLADIGLVKPDGTSRKPDHDKVNEFLNRVIDPLLDEVAARFDPTVNSWHVQGQTMDYTALMQVLVGWREQAWRNAEALVAAPDAQARAMVAQEIETNAAIQQNLLIAATAYSSVTANVAINNVLSLNATVNVMSSLSLQSLIDQALGDRTANLLAGVLPLFGGSSSPRRVLLDPPRLTSSAGRPRAVPQNGTSPTRASATVNPGHPKTRDSSTQTRQPALLRTPSRSRR